MNVILWTVVGLAMGALAAALTGTRAGRAVELALQGVVGGLLGGAAGAWMFGVPNIVSSTSLPTASLAMLGAVTAVMCLGKVPATAMQTTRANRRVPAGHRMPRPVEAAVRRDLVVHRQQTPNRNTHADLLALSRGADTD